MSLVDLLIGLGTGTGTGHLGDVHPASVADVAAGELAELLSDGRPAEAR
jgi:hypothetical protein